MEKLKNLNRKQIQIIFGVLSLAALLSYNFIHTGELLSKFIVISGIGYVAAFGIEACVVAMSVKMSDNPTKLVKFVLVTTLIVSGLANITQGYEAFYNEPLTVANIVKIDLIQSIVGLASTGLISLIVFALSDILGAETLGTRKKIVKAFKQKVQSIESKSDSKLSKSERQQKVAQLLSEGVTQEKVAELLNVSRGTIVRDKSELNGR